MLHHSFGFRALSCPRLLHSICWYPSWDQVRCGMAGVSLGCFSSTSGCSQIFSWLAWPLQFVLGAPAVSAGGLSSAWRTCYHRSASRPSWICWQPKLCLLPQQVLLAAQASGNIYYTWPQEAAQSKPSLRHSSSDAGQGCTLAAQAA